MQGRIIILNGAPRAGKSTLAKAVRDTVPGNWINWGVDAYSATLPADMFPGIGLRPGGERPDIEALLPKLYDAYFGMLSLFSRTHFDVLADLGLHNHYATPFDPMVLLQRHCATLPVKMVGVFCDLDTIMARRNASDPGRYERGPGVPEPVRRWQEAVHRDKAYDLILDMGRLSPIAGAQAIADMLRRS